MSMRVLRWLVPLAFVVVLFLPYSYEAGGPFKLMPAEVVEVRAQVDGDLREVRVQEGDFVEAGQVLAVLDVRALERDRDVLRAELTSAQAQLDLLTTGARAEELAIAERNVEIEQAALDLLRNGARPEEIAIARKKVDVRQAKLDLLRNGARPEEIAIARQDVEYQRIQVDFNRTELERLEGMAENDATTDQELEKARRQLEAAEQLHLTAKDRLAIVEQGARPEEIAAAEGELAAAQDELAIIEQGARAEEIQAAEKALEVAREQLAIIEDGARDEEVTAAQAKVHDLQARLRFVEQDIELAVVKAPIAGQLATPKIDMPVSGKVVTPYLESRVGEYLRKGDLLITIQRVDTLHAEIRIAEHDIPEVEVGAKARFKLWGEPTETYEGVVKSIAPRAEPTAEGHVVRVLCALPNPEHALIPETMGEAKILSERRTVLSAFTRQLVRFVRVEIWSWLP